MMEMKAMTTAVADREILTPAEVAEYLNVSRTYVYLLLRRGDIPYLKLDRLTRIRRADVDRYLESKMAGR